VVAATGSLVTVASAASFTLLIYYGIANVAALRMPRENKIPALGLVSCAVLATSLPMPVIAMGRLC
jgi:APA family basic amino acid/polyamine antiporter